MNYKPKVMKIFKKIDKLEQDIIELRLEMKKLLHPPKLKIGDRVRSSMANDEEIGVITKATFVYKPQREIDGEIWGESVQWMYDILFDGEDFIKTREEGSLINIS